ncbi:MAG: LysM peptidoglycan-binding domain-containing protein [Peptococcaceae bacterium]|nr:LysM peptidoglycan-binding domain-containing protein [Peptococcaceae bacterium]
MRSLLIAFITALLVIVPVTIVFAASYTVVPGDTLYTIGQRFGVSVQEIKAASGYWSNTIYPGQKLVIPDNYRNTYRVKPGDTLFKIATRYGIDYRDIMRANNLRSSLIYPGQKLLIPSRNSSVSRGLISSRDFDLLARLITAEADDQPFEVKVAVGAVILNRVKSALFPNTIAGVIYDRSYGHYQFEPVLNGWINRPASYEALQAARVALSGWDPSWGALYFFEPWVTNRFLHSLPVARDLGAFRFAYAA